MLDQLLFAKLRVLLLLQATEAGQTPVFVAVVVADFGLAEAAALLETRQRRACQMAQLPAQVEPQRRMAAALVVAAVQVVPDLHADDHLQVESGQTIVLGMEVTGTRVYQTRVDRQGFLY